MITWAELKTIFQNSNWNQNPCIVQILGLCPLLAVSTNLINGVMLALATIIVMSLSGFVVSVLRHLIPYEIRIPVFILIAATLVTVVDLSINAFMHEMYLILGIFIPLIVTNCIVLARIEAYAAKQKPLHSLFDGAFMGMGLLWTLGLLGGLRELIGGGTLFSGIESIVPTWTALQILPADYPGFMLAILPPGAFILLGCMIAAKNWLDARAAAQAKLPPPEPVATAGCH